MRVSLTVLVAALVIGSAPAQAATGGPDGWGYTWADSDETGVTYLYEFAPTRYAIGDDASNTFALGFEFLFYGVNYSSISVNSNGLVHFNGTAPPSTNWPLPYEDYALIAALWDNLYPPNGELWVGPIGTSPNRVFIIEWFEIPHYADVGACSFEIKLFEADDTIEIHYQDLSFEHSQYDWGASATVGIQDGGQGHSLQFSYNQPELMDEYAIRFEPCEDLDGDSYGSVGCGGTDCNDGDAQINPGAVEDCYDGLDNDCDGLADAGDSDCAGDDDDTVDDDDNGDDDDGPPPDDDQADDDGKRGGPYGIRCAAAGSTSARAPLTVIMAVLAGVLVRRRWAA